MKTDNRVGGYFAAIKLDEFSAESGTFPLTGNPDKTVQAMIDVVNTILTSLRLALGDRSLIK